MADSCSSSSVVCGKCEVDDTLRAERSSASDPARVSKPLRIRVAEAEDGVLPRMLLTREIAALEEAELLFDAARTGVGALAVVIATETGGEDDGVAIRSSV